MPWRRCAARAVPPRVIFCGLCSHVLAVCRGVLRLCLWLSGMRCVPRGELVRRGGHAAYGLPPWLLLQQHPCDLCSHVLNLCRWVLRLGLWLSGMRCVPSW